MGLFGRILKTGFDLATSPVALLKDSIPGCGGYIDGNRSYCREKIKQVADDAEDIRTALEEI